MGVIFVAVFLVFNTVFAQSVADPNSQLQQGVKIIEQPLGLASFDIRLIIANIIRVALGLVGIIMVGLGLYAGFLWMTAGGNEEQITQAKSVLRNAVIGLAIILSAYSIVSFVMNMLGVGGGGAGESQTSVSAPGTQNFAGSGALGKVIKDHYPARDQVDVPRNTKIIVTFFKPVLLSSFVEDSNNNGTLGDCKNISDPVFNWDVDCDHIKVDTTTKKLTDNFINVKRTDSGVPIKGLVLLATSSTVNGIEGIYTIVLKPITDATGGYLESPTEKVGYTIYLGAGILADDSVNDNPSIFQSKNIGDNKYYWQFVCSNLLDNTPPSVVGVFPASTKNNANGEPKNSVIQISFSEPINPIDVQGSFKTINGQSYYSLSGNKVFLKSDNSSVPIGNFNLVNNYQTLEFTPSKECGKNACGNPIYCLPVCDKTGAKCKDDNYQILLTAAKTMPGSFQSQPFTGIEDLSSNALDGNSAELDGKPDGVAQTAPTTLPVFDQWKQSDNYFWTFKINDAVDKTSPYITKITPGVDAQDVPKDADLILNFSKQMRVDSMYSIDIQEYPAPTSGVPLWKVPFVDLSYQKVKMNHGPFLDKINKFYFPVVSSTVEDVHFNCFYPGLGPADTVIGVTLDSKVCDPSQPGNSCCKVQDVGGSEFCCDGQAVSAVNGLANCIKSVINNKTIGS